MHESAFDKPAYVDYYKFLCPNKEEVFDFLGEMAASFDVGRFFREGVPVAIIGRPKEPFPPQTPVPYLRWPLAVVVVGEHIVWATD